MHRLIVLFSVVAALLCGTALAGAKSSGNPDAGVVVRAEFGLFHAPETGKPFFVPTKVVPLTPGQVYGWIVVLRTSKPTIRLREEFTLPEKPETWGIPETLGTRSISEDGRTAITEREVILTAGALLNSWAVAPGDPPGRYVIRVFVEGALAGVFEFEVR